MEIPPSQIEACILAGGLSTRMGREKARLKFCGRTLLGHARALVDEVGLPRRVIRRDAVPRCGPLGGIITALRTTKLSRVLFLSCDMPFITPKLVQQLLDDSSPNVFVEANGRVDFPFCLAASALAIAEAQHAKGHYSLQIFAGNLESERVALEGDTAEQLFNINSPEDLETALKRGA